MDEAQLFEKRVRLYQGKILGLLQRYVHDEHTRHDLLQQTLLRAWIHRDSFQGHSRYSTWLLKIAINTAITYLVANKKKIKIFTEIESGYENIPNVENYMYAAPDHYLSGIESWKRLGHEMMQLPKEDREALVLTSLYAYEYKDVAKMFGVPTYVIKRRLHRARNKLRAALKDEL